MPPSTLGPHVSAVTCTSVREARTWRSVAFSTRAIRRTCLPLMWVSMAVRAPSRVMQERPKWAARKRTRPRAAASRTSRMPCATDVGRRRRGTGAVTVAMTLAKQASLEREAGEGIQQGLALAPEWNPGEPRALERGLVLGRGSHRVRSAASARRGEAGQQHRVLYVVEAAVDGGALARPRLVRGWLCREARGQVLKGLEPPVAERGHPRRSARTRGGGIEPPEWQVDEIGRPAGGRGLGGDLGDLVRGLGQIRAVDLPGPAARDAEEDDVVGLDREITAAVGTHERPQGDGS